VDTGFSKKIMRKNKKLKRDGDQGHRALAHGRKKPVEAAAHDRGTSHQTR
jgi:hypothetical protein